MFFFVCSGTNRVQHDPYAEIADLQEALGSMEREFQERLAKKEREFQQALRQQEAKFQEALKRQVREFKERLEKKTQEFNVALETKDLQVKNTLAEIEKKERLNVQSRVKKNIVIRILQQNNEELLEQGKLAREFNQHLTDENRSLKTKFERIMECMECPITHQRVVNPFCLGDGYVYEKEAIKQWLAKKHTSPMTNAELKCGYRFPSITFKNIARILYLENE
jgi:hypothetical protein